MEELFTQYYLQNTWGEPRTVSGQGSVPEHTDTIRKAIPEIIEKYGITSILDAPCGDYSWFRLIDRKIPYIGGDIVAPLIEQNQKNYGDEITKFIKLDITKDTLPTADLMLCRDCLQHFSNTDVHKFLENFRRSNIKYLLTTNCGDGESTDISTGGYRKLDLHANPFSLPLPLEAIPEWNWDGFPPKTLILLSKDTI